MSKQRPMAPMKPFKCWALVSTVTGHTELVFRKHWGRLDAEQWLLDNEFSPQHWSVRRVLVTKP